MLPDSKGPRVVILVAFWLILRSIDHSPMTLCTFEVAPQRSVVPPSAPRPLGRSEGREQSHIGSLKNTPSR